MNIHHFVVTELIKQAAAVETSQPTRNNILNQLSKREQEVALYMTEGLSNQAIAEKMFVSLRTVKAHLSFIYDKTNQFPLKKQKEGAIAGPLFFYLLF